MSRPPWPARILRVVDHIQAHLHEELRPEALAELAGFSLHHFHRVFRGLTGETVMGFVRRLRLELAAQRLSFSGLPITDIALTSGYASHEAFTRAFRARFGTSPRRWRGRSQEPGSIPRVAMRELPPRTVLAMRHVGPYEASWPAWTALQALCAQLGLHRDEEAIGLCYDDPDVTEPARIRYDVAVVVPERAPLALPEAAAEPVVERYLYNPAITPPEDLLTEVQVRTAPA